MKCRDFELDVADWIRQRLDESQSQAMEAHAGKCDRCRELAAAERRIQHRMAALSAPELRRDLWPELAVRLEETASAYAERRPRTRLRWVLVGALAVALAIVGTRIPRGHQTVRLAAVEDEARVVRMMADLEPVRFVEADVTGLDLYQSHEVQRVVLVGDSGSR